VTARGNRREPIFFEDGDQEIYADLLAEQMRKAEVEVWAYCPEYGDRSNIHLHVPLACLSAQKQIPRSAQPSEIAA